MADYGGPGIRRRALSGNGSPGNGRAADVVIDEWLKSRNVELPTVNPADAAVDRWLAEQRPQVAPGVAPAEAVPTQKPGRQIEPAGAAPLLQSTETTGAGLATDQPESASPAMARFIAERREEDVRFRPPPDPVNAEAMEVINQIRRPAFEKADIAAARDKPIPQGAAAGLPLEMTPRELEAHHAAAKPYEKRRLPQATLTQGEPGAWARLVQPWKNLAGIPRDVVAKLTRINPTIDEAIEAELAFRRQKGLYDPEEAEDKALRASISREMQLGLPMYDEVASALQREAYEDMARFSPQFFPHAEGFWNKLASAGGELSVLLAELAVFKRALGLGRLAKGAARAVGAPALEGPLYLGTGFGLSEKLHGGEFGQGFKGGAILGGLGVGSRTAVRAMKGGAAPTAEAVGAAGATSAYFTGKTVLEGGDAWDVVIAGILIPLGFHGRELAPSVVRGLAKSPAAADRILGKAVEAVRAGRDATQEVRRIVRGLTDGTLSFSKEGRKVWRDLRRPAPVKEIERATQEGIEQEGRGRERPAPEERGLPPEAGRGDRPGEGREVVPPAGEEGAVKDALPVRPSEEAGRGVEGEVGPEPLGRGAPGVGGVGPAKEKGPPETAEVEPLPTKPAKPPQVSVEKEVESVKQEANFGLSLDEVREVNERFPIGEATPFDPHSSALKPSREGFDADLMAATKQIQATARYDPLRRHKALGLFTATSEASKRKIATQDVRWTVTLAHELGHAVDFEMAGQNLKTFTGAKIKEKLPDLKISEKEARTELMAASEIVRPLGSAGWAASKYRRKGTELMADLFALYAHDPAQTRKVAPNVTAAFETEVSRNPKLAAILETVMKPLPVELPKVGLKGSGAKTPVDYGDKIVGSEDDPGARATVDELRLHTKREMEVASFRVSREASAWEELLPKTKDREDVGALVEGIGNLKTGESHESIKARMTPEMEKVLREYQHKHELARQEVNKLAEMHAGEKDFINFLEDHLPHYYKQSKKIRQFATRWSTRTPHTKKRVLPTLKDAVEAGLEPITQDVAYLHRKSAELNYKAALTLGFVKQLRKLEHSITGEPLVVASQDKAGPDWVRIEHPAMRRVFAHKDKAGKMHLWHNFAYVHPAISRSVQTLLDSPFTTNWARGLTSVSAVGKMLNVGWSGFHGFTLGESATATLATAVNPMRGLAIGANESRKLGFGFKPLATWKAGHKIAEADPLGVEDALRHGLTLTRQASADYFRTDIEKGLKAFEELVEKHAGLGLQYIPKAARRSFEMVNKQLWDNLHAGWKMYSYHQIVAEELGRAPGDMSPKQIKETVAKHVNNAFGGQEEIKRPVARRTAEGKLKIGLEAVTPKEMQALRWLLFAPDWTYSNIAIAGQPLGGSNKLARKLGRRYWRNMGLQMTAGLAGVQRSVYLLAQAQGDDDYQEFPWLNEPGRHWDLDITPIKRLMPWHDPEDKRRYYARPFKQAKEVWGWMEEPRLLLTRKLGFVPRIVLEQFTGQSGDFLMPWHPESWEHLKGWAAVESRAKALGENFIPFSWQENNFAFVLPLRKGMSRYRAQNYFKQAIEAHVNPGLYRRATKDIPGFQKALVDVVKEVRDAMKVNGFDSKQIKQSYQSAKTKVKSEYYDKMWRAIDRQDGDDMRKWAEKLGQLGATRKSVKQSAERRGRPAPLSLEVTEGLRTGKYKSLPNELSFEGLIRR